MSDQPDIYERVRTARDFAFAEARKELDMIEELEPGGDNAGMERLVAQITLQSYRTVVETLNVVLGEDSKTDLFAPPKD